MGPCLSSSRRVDVETQSESSAHRVPKYWKLHKKCITTVNQGEAHTFLHTTSEKEQKAIKKLIAATWESDKVGHGVDARNLRHKHIQVLKVERLENLDMWNHYCEFRKGMFVRLKRNKQSRFSSVETLHKSSGPVRTTQKIHPGSPLSREIYPAEVNEHYLFHGTKKNNITAITMTGLDCRLANDNSMLGHGVYTAECPTKSDQYTDRDSEENVLILARVLLGEPFVNKAKNPPKYSRPPCMECHKIVCSCTNQRLYDSIIDDGGRLFREFVVYDRFLCYPEYIITYRRENHMVEDSDEEKSTSEQPPPGQQGIEGLAAGNQDCLDLCLGCCVGETSFNLDNCMDYGLCDCFNSCGGKGLWKKLIAVVTVLVCLPSLLFTKVVIGSMYIHECPAEPMIPVYLAVFGCCGTLSLLITVIRFAVSDTRLGRTLTIMASVSYVFLFLWLIAGCVWVHGVMVRHHISNVVTDPNYCNQTLYLFSFCITTIYFVLTVCVPVFMIGQQLLPKTVRGGESAAGVSP